MVNKWKTTAIIFIIIAVVEFLIFTALVNLGMEVEEREYTCAYNICEETDNYYYDYYDNVCYCIQDDEVVSETFMSEG